MTTRKYGCNIDIVDNRDYLVDKNQLCGASRLPDQVDLRKSGNLNSVYDQGQLGSCLYNASATALDFVRHKSGKNFMRPSRMFAYYNGRGLEGTIAQDCGTQTRTAIKSFAQFGAPFEALWPYEEKLLTQTPPLHTYNSAKDDLFIKYTRVENNISQVSQVLASGYPIIFGFTVYTYFETELMETIGILNLPKSDESIISGHGVLAIGYDSTTKRVLVQNSYGTSWGLGGYFWVDYGYFGSSSLVSDLWVVTEVN
jgi:C1A family cysteine protease